MSTSRAATSGGQVLLLVDPMLAAELRLAGHKCAVRKAARPGIRMWRPSSPASGASTVMNACRVRPTIWAAAVDEELTSRSYIVPGIGDAGISLRRKRNLGKHRHTVSNQVFWADDSRQPERSSG